MIRYPAELEEHWDAAGEHLTIRPVRPDDVARERAFFGRLTPEDIRLRFFAAVRDATDEIVGVARLARNDDTGADEFAVVVQQDVKGKGLGTHMMRRLIDWARQHRITEICGEILAENTNMLLFARNLGFTLRHLPADPEMVEARLVLGAALGRG